MSSDGLWGNMGVAARAVGAKWGNRGCFVRKKRTFHGLG
jgi:hypothetical protein